MLWRLTEGGKIDERTERQVNKKIKPDEGEKWVSYRSLVLDEQRCTGQM